MKDTELLQQVLEIGDNWQITRIRDDLGARRLDLWVGEQAERSGWFFAQKQAPEAGPERVWRHVNVGNSRCFIHVAARGDLPTAGLPWCGEADMPFSRAMSRQVATLLWEGIKFQSICTLLDIGVDDLWKFKHSLDNGKIGLSSSAPAPAPAASPANASASVVPDPNDPIWEKLLDGSVNIDIRVLSLKLLLTKLREQMRVITDTEVRILKAHEMHRYFARYEQTLGHELAQLRQS